MNFICVCPSFKKYEISKPWFDCTWKSSWKLFRSFPWTVSLKILDSSGWKCLLFTNLLKSWCLSLISPSWKHCDGCPSHVIFHHKQFHGWVFTYVTVCCCQTDSVLWVTWPPGGSMHRGWRALWEGNCPCCPSHKPCCSTLVQYWMWRLGLLAVQALQTCNL